MEGGRVGPKDSTLMTVMVILIAVAIAIAIAIVAQHFRFLGDDGGF